MRKCLAVMFLIIFSFQVIPMKVIGKLLAKGQTEEEVKHSSDDCKDDGDGKTGKYNDLMSYCHHEFSVSEPAVKNQVWEMHRSEDVPAAPVTEIPCPPPNC